MNWKTLLILLILAGAAVYGVIAINKPPQSPPSASAEPSLLYPQLVDQINDVQRIRIIKAGDETAIDLARNEQNWVLANKHNYPVDAETLRSLLSGLLEAKIIETKTSNPERYAALEVEDVSADDAQGRRIDLEGPAEPIRLIVGKSGTGGIEETYVRKANEAQSLLVSGVLLPADDVQRWAEQPIVEIPAERIQRVVIKHPANGDAPAEQLTVVKDGRADTNFKVFNLLEGREISHETVANPIGNALSNLRLEDVSTVDAMNPAAQQPVVAEYYTFDGQKITVQTFKEGDKYYAQLSAVFDAEQFERFQPEGEEAVSNEESQEQATESDESASSEQVEPPAPAESNEEALARQTADLDARLQPWVFEISQYKYDSMNKRIEDMLKPVETPAESSSEAPVETPIVGAPAVQIPPAPPFEGNPPAAQ